MIYVVLKLLDIHGLETFSLSNGISTWPANAIRLFAFILAAGFLYHIKQTLLDNKDEIEREFKFHRCKESDEKIKRERLQPSWLIDDWGCIDSKKPQCAQDLNMHTATLWYGFWGMMSAKYFLVRFAVSLGLYVLCIIFLMGAGYFEFPNIPARGIINFMATLIILFIVVFVYLALIFIIADISHLVSRFIRLLRDHKIIWPSEKLDEYRGKYGSDEVAKQKLLIDMVHMVTGNINGFVFFPFIILFLLILARSHFFDNWHYTPTLFVVFAFTSIIVLISAMRLRKAAILTRDKVLEKLNAHYIQMPSSSIYRNNVKIQIDEIRSLNDGPFKPLSQHPIFLSILLPIGSFGGLYMVEYFLAAT